MPAVVQDLTPQRIRRLGEELLDNQVKHINHVVLLLRSIRAVNGESAALEAIQCLRVFFLDALHSSVASVEAGADDAAGRFLSFVKTKYAAYLQRLLACLQTAAPLKVQLAAVMAIMEAVRAESVGSFGSKTFLSLASTLLTSKHAAPEVVSMFVSQWACYADVRYHLLKWVGATARKLTQSQQQLEWQAEPVDIVTALFDMLSTVPASMDLEGGSVSSWCGGAEAGVVQAATAPKEGARMRRKRKLAETQAVDSGKAHALWMSPQAHKQVYSDAWLSYLQLPLPHDIYKRLLQTLTSTVLPFLKNPLLLSDFLTHSIDRGGLVGILALHGLFTLVTQHGLEYPDFYRRLYSLLTPQVFTARYRLKFLQLTDIFLASGLVPAYTAAAFAKRFARIALTAPPTGAAACVAFIHNLIRRHPGCVCLIHRPEGPGAAGAGEDVYVADSEDPAHSRAIESSLWELDALRKHINATVANSVQQLDRDLTDRKRTAEVNMSDILPQGYSTQINAELDKKLRKAPATVFFAADQGAKGLFDGGVPGWTAM